MRLIRTIKKILSRNIVLLIIAGTICAILLGGIWTWSLENTRDSWKNIRNLEQMDENSMVNRSEVWTCRASLVFPGGLW